MSDVAQRFHENWLGLVQPIDGLVVSIPALVAAECMEHQPPSVQRRLVELCRGVEDGKPCVVDLWTFLEDMLQLARDAFDVDDALPEDLQLYVPEGGQMLRPTAGLRKLEPDARPTEPVTMDDSTPASRAGSKYEMLLWRLPDRLDLDAPETQTGAWEYPADAKFDRLLRECRVPIGLLTNGQHLRLVYAPHGESSGALTFRLEDLVQVGGRPILDAMLMLLSDHRWFGADPARRLPAILKDSRARQADVTNTLADQMFEALTILLQGFEAAAERDGDVVLREALAQEGDHVYNGLLTVLLRLVFLLYAEDRSLMPSDHEVYSKHLSVLALFDALQADNGAFPDTMGRRFGAYPRLLALFRAVFYGVRAGKLTMPPRRGVLFDPGMYPFLDGAGSGAPAFHPAERAELRVPSVSDETIHRVLQKLLVLGGQRLSYRALEVEQIGSVYEALMGYHVHRCASASVCLRGAKVWVGAAEVRDVEPGRRARWFEDVGLAKAQAKKLAEALAGAKHEADVLTVLEGFAAAKIPTARAGTLVIQPGEERRRTSSHYTPRSLTEPMVRRTLEPLIMAMGGEPPSEKLLRLKICDPAMGSGAFLVAVCRFLADQVVAAWTREGVLKEIVAGDEDPVMHARRLVAQKCLYGVDKNPFAVNLAKLSIWLETLARHEPFTFVDHALKCGDSLVGLSIAQIKRFEWTPDGDVEAKAAKKAKRGEGRQLGLFDGVIERALLQAHTARRRLLELAEAKGDHVAISSAKRRLHEEAELALERARIIGDVLIGAFFAKESDKARLREATERKVAVEAWLAGGSDAFPPLEAQRWLAEIREAQRPFHWELEFPEVFWDERPDPLENDAVNRSARLDAILSNPPFAGINSVAAAHGPSMKGWLWNNFPGDKGVRGNVDYAVFFLLQAARLIGKHGTTGILVTKTAFQGDSRKAGIKPILKSGWEILDARLGLTWPGEAAVTISTICLGIGAPLRLVERRLDGARVSIINSRLAAAPERPDPVVLTENENKSFQGAIVLGMGFTLTQQEREALVQRDPHNAERILPYLGGEEVNTHPTQNFDRYVINFSHLSLEQAGQWPTLLELVRAKVKPERDKLPPKNGWNRDVSTRWWQFAAGRPNLHAALAGLERCLVTSVVSKHLIFSFQPTGRIFSHKLYIFPFDDHRYFGALQSRIHESWTRLLSSTMRSDLNYSASDCFETFPFPRDLSPLGDIGRHLDTTRAAFMREANIGLTKIYNALKDPANISPSIVGLRKLHVELDRAVLGAYGWSDIDVPPFDLAPDDPPRRQFTDQILDRLVILNAERAAEQQRLGSRATKPPSGSGTDLDTSAVPDEYDKGGGDNRGAS